MNQRQPVSRGRLSREDLLFLASGLAVLALFLSLSVLSFLLIGVGLAVLIGMIVRRTARPTTFSLRTMRMISVILTGQLLIAGYRNFQTTWMLSSRLKALAASVGLPFSAMLTIVGLILCAVSLYAMNVLACLMVKAVLRAMKKLLPEPRRQVILANLKANWFFPLSAAAFFLGNATLKAGYEAGLQISFLAAMILASQVPSMAKWARKKRLVFRALALASAVGICLGENEFYVLYWTTPEFLYALRQVIPATPELVRGMSAAFAALGLPAVFLGVLFFWERLGKMFRTSGLFSGIRRGEGTVYALLLTASLGMMLFSFLKSDAFYGTKWLYDIIYTSDSPDLMKENAFLALTQGENDIRQPLFAVFAAPFTGLPYLIGRLSGSIPVRAICIHAAQILLLYTAQFMLARALKLDSRRRICWMLFLFCTYTQLLFTLMIEQYIVAYFWLALCVYQISEKDRPDRLALWGAGGSLLTSLVLLPFRSTRNPRKQLGPWLADIFFAGAEFLGLTLAFCRFDLYCNLGGNVSFLSGFMKEKVSFGEKLYQYVAFIRNCFLAPAAGAMPNVDGAISWQLYPITSLRIPGLILLGLALISFLWNRKKRSSQLAGGWILLSLALLLLFGWGTQENGLILYSLYFGWAFMALLFQLAEKAEDKLKTRFLLPAVTVVACVGMLAVNLPGMAEMIRFAISHYPI